jgi:hypothetical protein
MSHAEGDMRRPARIRPRVGASSEQASSLVPELPADEHEEELIDEALTETFPASDPIAVAVPRAVA